MSEDGYISIHMASFYFHYVLDMQILFGVSGCGYIAIEDQED